MRFATSLLFLCLFHAITSDPIVHLMDRDQLDLSCTRVDGSYGLFKLLNTCVKATGEECGIVGFIKHVGAVVCCAITPSRMEKIEIAPGLKAKDYCDKFGEVVSDVVISNNIINGKESGLAEFPHMVSLGYENLNEIIFDCGGSLISTNYVITAAHCINYRKKLVKIISVGRVSDLLSVFALNS